MKSTQNSWFVNEQRTACWLHRWICYFWSRCKIQRRYRVKIWTESCGICPFACNLRICSLWLWCQTKIEANSNCCTHWQDVFICLLEDKRHLHWWFLWLRCLGFLSNFQDVDGGNRLKFCTYLRPRSETGLLLWSWKWFSQMSYQNALGKIRFGVEDQSRVASGCDVFKIVDDGHHGRDRQVKD